MQSTWNNSLAQFIVMDAASNRPTGFVSLYDVNFQDGFGYVAATKFDPSDRSLRLMTAVLLFIDYAFEGWRFRKLYLEVPEYNLGQFQGAVGKYLNVEARLKQHMFSAGEYWDQFTLSLFKEGWEEARNSFAALLEGDELGGRSQDEAGRG